MNAKNQKCLLFQFKYVEEEEVEGIDVSAQILQIQTKNFSKNNNVLNAMLILNLYLD